MLIARVKLQKRVQGVYAAKFFNLEECLEIFEFLATGTVGLSNSIFCILKSFFILHALRYMRRILRTFLLIHFWTKGPLQATGAKVIFYSLVVEEGKGLMG